MRKRISSIVISALLAMAAFTVVMAYTVDDVYADGYLLWVGGQQVSNSNKRGSGWRYSGNDLSGTLFLDTNGTTIGGTREKPPICVERMDLTIKFVGSNSKLFPHIESDSVAIRQIGPSNSITIVEDTQAPGTLTVYGTIETEGNLTIRDTKVIVSGGAENGKGCINVGGTFKVEDTDAGSDAIVDVTGDNDTTAIKANAITLTETGIQTPEGGTVGTLDSVKTVVGSNGGIASHVIIKPTLSADVTFKVRNGKWNDDSTADKTVTLNGFKGDTLKLTADQIPAVGSKPNDNYKAGSWDTTPDTTRAITGNTTYTYSYIPEGYYSVTTRDDGHGTATASPTSGREGTSVTVTATPADDSYRFKEWQVISGGIDLADRKSATTTFSIKNADVTVKALFEKIKSEKKDDDDDDDEDEPAPSKQNTKIPDGFEELRAQLAKAAATAKATGKPQTVFWSKGTSLPYDVMNTLHNSPLVTLVFSYQYLGQNFTVTIPGSLAYADPAVAWCGPVYLYMLYGKVKVPVSVQNTTAANGTYTVRSGDTLKRIASNLGTSVKHLQSVNNIKDPDRIKTGMVLRY